MKSELIWSYVTAIFPLILLLFIRLFFGFEWAVLAGFGMVIGLLAEVIDLLAAKHE